MGCAEVGRAGGKKGTVVRSVGVLEHNGGVAQGMG
jgi:hypothetical protein